MKLLKKWSCTKLIGGGSKNRSLRRTRVSSKTIAVFTKSNFNSFSCFDSDKIGKIGSRLR